MRDAGWIAVVEEGELWTAWVRSAVRRAAPEGFNTVVEHLESCPPVESPNRETSVLLAIEVTRDNLSEVLDLSSCVKDTAHLALAALVSRSVGDAAARREVGWATLEAGAAIAVSSPRDCGRVVQVGLRHFEQFGEVQRLHLTPQHRALRRLPWQPRPWPLP